MRIEDKIRPKPLMYRAMNASEGSREVLEVQPSAESDGQRRRWQLLGKLRERHQVVLLDEPLGWLLERLLELEHELS